MTQCEAHCTSSRNVGRRCGWNGHFDHYHQAVLCTYHAEASELAFTPEAARRILRDRNRMWMRDWRAVNAA